MHNQCNSKIRNIKGESPAKSGISNSQDQLIQRAIANEKLRNLNHDLYKATQANDYEKVIALIKQGANLHLSDRSELHKYNDDEYSPLHIAASNGSLKIVKLFIEHGTHVNAQNRRFITPLHKAVHNNHVDIIDYLVKHGANVHALDDDGGTPISWASYVGALEAAKKLVKLGTNIHQPDKNSSTPLHWACYKGHLELVEFLIEQGADTDMEAVNVDGDTPLKCSIENGHVEIALYLIEIIKKNVAKKTAKR